MRRTAPWVSLVNTLGAARVRGARAHPGRVFDRMLSKAERLAEADAALAPEFVESYRFLLDCAAETEGISLFGWEGFVDDLTRRMASYLRVERLVAERSEIAREPIERPVVVTGLPRTGTTLTHRMLSAHHGNRAPLLWELVNTDLSGADEKLKRRRIRQARAMGRLGGMAAPGWNRIHPLEALQPEECVFALPHGHNFTTRASMPAYLAWLDAHDFTPDYEHYRRVLQVLQFGLPRRRWMLKAPFHLFNLDVLLKVFDGATIVWTHRAPSTVMGSWCSLVETARALTYRTVDPAPIGPEWLGIFPQGIEAARRVRAGAAPGRFIDVSYDRLTDNPHGELPILFGELEMGWTGAEEDTLRSVLERPDSKRGHQYRLSRYGIDADRVDREFGDYWGQ
ncbi:sulfotransferase family protein [Glycomyces salinus]|uniref:sulfotransferase family protein n=1 Tax=Glycomyces salinus TaxID=980294 RepID=UPI0018ECB2B1|nr:sulfotransferase [Glycomyces salinus]